MDRKRYLIKTGGENVYPAEVEAAVVAHPAVQEVCVFSVPDPHWGEAVAAVVVTEPGGAITTDELVRWCKERLAGFKVPRYLRFAASADLPRSPRYHREGPAPSAERAGRASGRGRPMRDTATPDQDELGIDDEGPVRVLTFRRPHRLNALSGELAARVTTAIGEAEAAGTVRALVVTGVGEHFSAGGDAGSIVGAIEGPNGSVAAR